VFVLTRGNVACPSHDRHHTDEIPSHHHLPHMNQSFVAFPFSSGDGKFISNETGITYVGSWLDGLKHGLGTLYFESGDEIVGRWNEVSIRQCSCIAAGLWICCCVSVIALFKCLRCVSAYPPDVYPSLLISISLLTPPLLLLLSSPPRIPFPLLSGINRRTSEIQF
jgi:MORN repeat